VATPPGREGAARRGDPLILPTGWGGRRRRLLAAAPPGAPMTTATRRRRLAMAPTPAPAGGTDAGRGPGVLEMNGMSWPGCAHRPLWRSCLRSPRTVATRRSARRSGQPSCWPRQDFFRFNGPRPAPVACGSRSASMSSRGT
jgi:hypothetical protein